MKKFVVMLIVSVALIASVFASDLSFLEDFQVKEGDEICVIMNTDDVNEGISFRIYLNEDKTNPDNFCNRVYRIVEGGRFEDSAFEVVSVTFGGMDYTSIMEGYEFTGKELIEGIEMDLKVFKNLVPEVKIDDSGSYYYGYDVSVKEMQNFVEEVADYIYSD